MCLPLLGWTLKKKSKDDKCTLAPTCVWNRYIKKSMSCSSSWACGGLCVLSWGFISKCQQYEQCQVKTWLQLKSKKLLNGGKIIESVQRETHTRSRLLRATRRSRHLPVPSSPTHRERAQLKRYESAGFQCKYEWILKMQKSAADVDWKEIRLLKETGLQPSVFFLNLCREAPFLFNATEFVQLY